MSVRQRLHYVLAARLPLKKGVIPNARGFYAALVVTMDPRDFIRLTVRSEAEVGRIIENTKVGLRDYNKAEYFMPFLDVNYSDGRVLGHEGRHRAAMIIKEGGTVFPVLIAFRQKYFGVRYELDDDEAEDEGMKREEFTSLVERNHRLLELRDQDGVQALEPYDYVTTLKGSPDGSDPSRWRYAPFKPSDMPRYLVGQFNAGLVIPTAGMKIGVVKGYRHFRP